MNVKELTLKSPHFPDRLRTIPMPPQKLYVLCKTNVNELLARPCLTVIGSRKVSSYGREVTSALAGELAKSGAVIISGLAIGIDSIAHRAALDVGGLTIAVLPSGFRHVYPAQHRGLAQEILERGGALVSEHPPDMTIAYKGNFIARNRIASGLSDAILITEAAAKSGTLHTAEFALEQGREVLAVPGNITSPTSVGTNTLIRSGATPVIQAADIFHALGIAPTKGKQQAKKSNNPNEQALLNLLETGISNGDDLLEHSKLPVTIFNQTLTMLEINGTIRPLGSNHWALN